jgi:hypothetical protein
VTLYLVVSIKHLFLSNEKEFTMVSPAKAGSWLGYLWTGE